MASVIRMNGRIVAATRDYRSDFVAQGGRPLAANTRPDDRPCDGTPIPPDSPDSPFRDGTPYEDPHEGVTYRILHRINIAEGWGTAAFWTARWQCYFADLLQLVRMGWLDAAMERGSAVKRYRCRDELRVRAWLAEHRVQASTPTPAPKAAKTPSRARKKV